MGTLWLYFIVADCLFHPWPEQLPEYLFQTGDIEVIRRSTLLDGSISGRNVLPIYIDECIYILNLIKKVVIRNKKIENKIVIKQPPS